MKKILIVKTGYTFSTLAKERGDFEHWVIEKSGFEKEYFEIFNPLISSNFPDPFKFSGIILTGSHDMVTEQLEWSQKTGRWLKNKAHGNVPILGICYGHQLIAQALGGMVAYNQDGMEIGTVPINLYQNANEMPLFEGVKFPFSAHMSHSQSVIKLPDNAINLAYTEKCEIAAFFNPPFTFGVQFHPEFDGEIVRYYVLRSKQKLEEEKQDIEEILQSIRETPEATDILNRFCQFCLQSEWNLQFMRES